MPVTAWAPAAELDPADTGHALATPILSRRERIPAYQATGVIDAGADAVRPAGIVFPVREKGIGGEASLEKVFSPGPSRPEAFGLIESLSAAFPVAEMRRYCVEVAFCSDKRDCVSG